MTPDTETVQTNCIRLNGYGYDTDAVVKSIRDRETEVVIPPKSNRVEPREYDTVLYRARNLVECCVGKLKPFRRVATRYEKRSRNFLGMVTFAAVTIWLK